MPTWPAGPDTVAVHAPGGTWLNVVANVVVPVRTAGCAASARPPDGGFGTRDTSAPVRSKPSGDVTVTVTCRDTVYSTMSAE